jgi:hypothetical protein
LVLEAAEAVGDGIGRRGRVSDPPALDLLSGLVDRSMVVNYEIYVMTADGANPARITNNPALDSDPDWQPL